MPSIEVIDGPDLGALYTLHDLLVIGRSPEKNTERSQERSDAIRLNDSKCSRTHLEIRRLGSDTFQLRDLDSSNGTFINGQKVSGPRSLRDGDQIRLGATTFKFHLKGNAPTSRNQTLDDDTVVQTLAAEVSVDALLTDQRPERVGMLKLLLDLAGLAEKAENPEQLAQILADGLVKEMEGDRVFLFVGRDESMQPVERQLPPHEARIYKQPYSTTVVRRTAREKVSVLSCLPEDDRFKDAASVLGNISSAICVPLVAGGNLLGAIYIDRLGGEGSPFDEQALHFATAAGQQCAMALLNIQRLGELRASRDRLEAELNGPQGFIGESKVLRPVYDFVKRVAPTSAGVLILGESGTGKELVSRAIHRNSPRKDRPFVIVNCAALAESLAEAELFGHQKGAFTGAEKARTGKFLAADGGTIFLDEIGELSEPIQAKLLRVLEEGELMPVGEAHVRRVDVRVVAATNRDLAKEVEVGRFRRDLYFRLNILQIQLPPLRERREDIPMLIAHFTKFFGERCGRPNMGIDPAVLERARNYDWPGNVRELRNAVERMVILARGDHLATEDLPPEVAGRGGIQAEGSFRKLQTLADMERDHIQWVLDQVEGNKSRAAEILGIDRSTLYAKLKAYT